jgi:sulfite exporter TauE/SafE
MEFNLWVLLRGLAVGALFGAVPVILGAMRNQRRLGFRGLLACVAGALLLGMFLAIPAAIAFVWLILRADRRAAAARQSAAQNRRRYADVRSYPLPLGRQRRPA